MITQKEIARILGISQMTVSAIMRNGELSKRYRPELREKVLKTAAQYGYCRNEIACAVRYRKSNVIGFVSQELGNGYSGVILQGVIDAAAERSFLVKIFSINSNSTPGHSSLAETAANLAGQCIGQRLAGLICFDVVFPEVVEIINRKLYDNGIPLLMANDQSYLAANSIGVYSDNAASGKLAFEHFHALGHRKFALLGGYRWTDKNRLLLKSFKQAAESAGIPPENVLDLIQDEDWEYHMYREPLLDIRPTAVFSTCDPVALNTMTSLTADGFKIPRDFAIMGVGNLAFSRVCRPGLTSLDENLYTIGYRSAELILAHGCNPVEEPYRELIRPSLVIRESTAAAE